MIYLPPPQPATDRDICIHGDVEIHPTASLAPGVILQAAPNSRIVIGANVCLGMGTILNAIQGSIEVESGVTLGSGVLIIGESKIGSNACIGTATTIFQASISSMEVVNPGSIIGDVSRKVENLPEAEDSSTNAKETEDSSVNNSLPKDIKSDRYYFKNNKHKIDNNSHNLETQDLKEADSTNNESSTNTEAKTIKKKGDSVGGQVYINQLLVTLFPHRKELDLNRINGKNKESK